MIKKKTIATAAAVALAAALVFGGGTLAYFTWTSDEVDNVVANNYNWVGISEDGAKKVYDDEDDESTYTGVMQNTSYEIIPGTSQAKEPIVTASYSLDSYVFVEVTDTSGGLINWSIDENAGWKLLTSYENSDGEMEYIYYHLVTASGTGYTATDTDGNELTYYIAELNVLSGKEISYSSSITNDNNGIEVDASGTPDVANASFKLAFQAYIIQADVSGNGSDDYSETDAWSVLNGGVTESEGVAQNDDTNVIYDSLTAAIAASEDDDTVVLLADRVESVTIEDQIVKLDLAGYTLSYEGTTSAVLDLESGAVVTLTDSSEAETGKITGTSTSNTASGGIFIASGAMLNLNGGSVTECSNTGNNATGVGIRVKGTMNMYGGTVSNNTVANGSGAGIYVDGGTLNLYDGEISGNKITANTTYGNGGAGIYVSKTGTVNMSGGEISGNSITAGASNTNYGGGVYVFGGTFTMTGGTITGNSANYGGGIAEISDNNTPVVSISGGSVTGNTAVENGGGIYTDGETHVSLQISGSPVITGNTVCNAANNVWVYNPEYDDGNIVISLVGEMTDGASVGVTLGYSQDDPITAWESGTSYYVDAAQYFTSDNSSYTVVADTTDHCLILEAVN